MRDIFKLLLMLCISCFVSVLFSYHLYYNFNYINNDVQRDLLSLSIIALTYIFGLKYGLKNWIIAGLAFIPIYFMIFFIAACSFYKDCI